MNCRAVQLLYLETLSGEMLHFGEESRKSVLCQLMGKEGWQNPSSVISATSLPFL